MSWATLATTDITSEILPDEVTLLNTIQGGTGILGSVLVNCILEIQAIILTAGNQIDTATTTVPDQIRSDCISYVRWKWFTSLPKTDLQSDFRKDQYEQYLKRMDKIRMTGDDRERVEIPTNPRNVAGPSFRVSLVRRGQEVRDFNKIGST